MLSASSSALSLANFFSFGRLSGKLFNVKLDVGSGVSGSGRVATDKRDVKGFSSVDVSGIFQVEIVSGKDFSVEVQADDNILPLIQTNVDGDTLKSIWATRSRPAAT